MLESVQVITGESVGLYGPPWSMEQGRLKLGAYLRKHEMSAYSQLSALFILCSMHAYEDIINWKYFNELAFRLVTVSDN